MYTFNNVEWRRKCRIRHFWSSLHVSVQSFPLFSVSTCPRCPCVCICPASDLFVPGVASQRQGQESRGEVSGEGRWGEVQKKEERRAKKTVGGSERPSSGRSAWTRCGANAPYCYDTTLTGLYNQTGLAFGSQQTPAALTVT